MSIAMSATGYDQVFLDALSTEITADLPSACSAWLVGSVAYQLDSVGSDVDVIALTDSDAEGPARLISALDVAGRLVDVAFVEPSWLRDITAAVREVAQHDQPSPASSAKARSWSDMRLLARVATGIALPGLEDARDSYAVSRRDVAVVFAFRHLDELQRSLLVGRLALRRGRLDVLADASHQVLRSTLELFGLLGGQLISGPKWAWEKARRVDPDFTDQAAAAAGHHGPADRWAAVTALVTEHLPGEIGSPRSFRLTAAADFRMLRFGDRTGLVSGGTRGLVWADRGGILYRLAASLRPGTVIEDETVDDATADALLTLLALDAVQVTIDQHSRSTIRTEVKP